MGKYKGFKCDSCGKVLEDTERNKKRVSFEGPDLDGSYTEDLCSECISVPEGVDFKPTKRRGPRVTPTVQVEAGGVAGDVGSPTVAAGMVNA